MTKKTKFKEHELMPGVCIIYDFETAEALNMKRPYGGNGWRLKYGPRPNTTAKTRARWLRNLL